LFDLRHEASREFDRKSRDLQVVTSNASPDARSSSCRPIAQRGIVGARSVSAVGRVLQYNR